LAASLLVSMKSEDNDYLQMRTDEDQLMYYDDRSSADSIL
jgi:hypothetical protein